MLITDTIWIRGTPERVFEFFENMEANFPRWHSYHDRFRWEEGRGVREGVTFSIDEVILGRATKKRAVFTRVEPNRLIELVFTGRAPRPLQPRIVYLVEPEGEGVRFTAEIHVPPGPFGPRLSERDAEMVHLHLQTEGKNLKRILEEPADLLTPFVSAVEPAVERLRAAVEANPEFRLLECGAAYSGPITLTLRVDCERTGGPFHDLKLSFRCWAIPPGEDYRGTLNALVDWHRPAGAGRRERTVYEARAEEIQYEGTPPVDALLAQLPRLEEAMTTALARGGPPGRVTRVYLVESEADRGRRIDEEIEFATPEDAERYAREYNERHNSGPIRSEWSMIAKLERPDGMSVLG